MEYLCWRCRGAVERTATDCGACGKPLVPAPRLLRPFWITKRHPDIVYLERTRRAFLPSVVILLTLAATLIALGLWMTVDLEALRQKDIPEQAEVRAFMDRRGTPPEERELVEVGLRLRTAVLEGLDYGTGALIGMGLALMTLVLDFAYRTRRLLAMLPPSPERPAPPD